MDLYYHHNSLGSVVAVTNAAGGVVESYRYSAFGKPTIYDEGGSEIATTYVEQPFLFTGARWDFEEGSGLYQMRLRYYDPAVGRFVSRDPLGLWGDPSQSGNGQGYCGHDPVNLVDPLGLDSAKERLDAALQKGEITPQEHAERVREHDTNGGDYQVGSGEGAVTVVGRGTWGANPPTGPTEEYDESKPLADQLDKITIHDTTDKGPIGPTGVKDIQADHQRKWSDIGYHFVIDKDGTIYEGRPVGVKGSHAEQDNTGNIGIVLAGDFESRIANGWQPESPTPEQLVALLKLLTALMNKYGVTPDQVWKHKERKAAKGLDSTECPGDTMETVIDMWRRFGKPISPPGSPPPGPAPPPGSSTPAPGTSPSGQGR